MTTVVSLSKIEALANQDAIEIAREVLARVESGETTAIAVVEVGRGGEVSTSSSKTDRYHYLNSGVALLAHSLASTRD